MLLALFGVLRGTSGEILLDGRKASLASPNDAKRGKVGMALIPEDRKTEGLMLPMSVRDNLSMASLARLASLPDTTLVYCGHEYTQKNLEFAALLEPGNADLRERRREVDRMRSAGRPTVPTTIALEKRTNPFLRSDSPELISNVLRRMPGAGTDPLSIFAATRKLKDQF